MANVIDRLVVELGLKGDELQAGLERASQALQNFGKQVAPAGQSLDRMAVEYSKSALMMGDVTDDVAKRIMEIGTTSQKASLLAGRAFGGLGQKIGSLGSLVMQAVAPLAAAFAGGQLFSNFSQMGEEMSNLSDRTGVAVDKIDAWAKANRDAGGSAEGFKAALEQWTVENHRSAEEFFRLGESVAGLSDRQAAQFMQARGLSQDAAAVFIKFKDAANGAADAYKGVAMTREQAERAREMNIQWRKFTDQAQALGNILAVVIVPIVNKVLTITNNGLSFIQKHGRAVKLVVGGLAAVIGGVYLSKVVAMAGGFAKLFATIKNGAGIVALLNKALLANPIAAVVAAVVALSLAFDDLFAFLEGGNSAIYAFLKWIGLSDDQIISFRDNINSLISAVKNFPSYLSGKLNEAWEEIKSIGSGIADIFNFEGIGESASAALSAFANGAEKYVVQPITTAVKAAVSAMDWLEEAFTDLPMKVAKAIPAAIDAVISVAEKIADAVISAVQSAIDWVSDAFKRLCASIFQWLTEAMVIGGKVKEKVGGAIDSVKSFFGIGEDEEPKKAPAAKRPSKDEPDIWSDEWTDQDRASRKYFMEEHGYDPDAMPEVNYDEQAVVAAAAAGRFDDPEVQKYQQYQARLGIYNMRKGRRALRKEEREKAQQEAEQPTVVPVSADQDAFSGDIAAQRAAKQSQPSISNNMEINVNNNIQTKDDPEAIGAAVGKGLDNTMSKRNRMLVNAQSGVVQKG